MPPKRQHDAQDANTRGVKRAKKDVNEGSSGSVPVTVPSFGSVSEISAALYAPNPAQLATNLSHLRNFVSSKTPDGLDQEGRLKLFAQWVGQSGVQDVEGVLESSNNLSTILTPLFSYLGAVLHALRTNAEHSTAHNALGNLLLSDRQAERLNRAVRQDDASLVFACMKVWLELASVEALQGRVSMVWDWGGKAGSKLLGMRRRGKFDPTYDPLQRPDIRTLYILFLLSFLTSSTPSALKQSFLGQRDTFTAIFRDMRRDHTNVVRRVLEVSWEGIWEDKRVRRTVKIGVFNEWMLSQILRVYERNEKDDLSHPFPAADLAHHFLLAICTRPGSGICFPDNGWYPRESDTGEDGAAATDDANDDAGEARGPHRTRVYNKILANFLKSLKVGEDARQQELALKILEACPELITAYWPTAGISLEPRLSSRWLVNAAFLGRVVSLPVPIRSFRFAPSSSSARASEQPYRPDPPPLAALIANTFPSLFHRAHLTKGLQAKQGLVQLFTAQTLSRCLEKFEQVRIIVQKIEEELGESRDEGQWRTRRRELEAEARRHVPDFSVVVAFSQLKMEGEGRALVKKRAMLREAALRLLWCYQRSLPELMAESRFDAGKLFRPDQDASTSDVQQEDKEKVDNLDALSRLHILRLLRSSEQFNWSAKPSGSARTYLYHFLRMRAKARHDAVKSASEELVQHILGTSLLFEHDPDELQLWLEALPTLHRDGTTLGPNDQPLTDEADSVIALLDDCVSRCLKTPYRYVEEMGALLTTEADATIPLSARAPSLPSPLLLTVLEQLKAKHRAGLLSFSDTFATLGFLRRLILALAGKSEDMQTPRLLIARLSEIVNSFESASSPENNVTEHFHFRKEVALLSDSVDMLSDPSPPNEAITHADGGFIQEARLSESDNIVEKRRLAARLVDQCRLLQAPLNASDFKRLVQVIAKHASGGNELLELLRAANPKTQNVWHALSLSEVGEIFGLGSPFWAAFFHADSHVISTSESMQVIVTLARPLLQNTYQASLLLRCIIARISACRRRKRSLVEASAYFRLLTAIFEAMPSDSRQHCKSRLLRESPIMREILLDSRSYNEDLVALLQTSLDSQSEFDNGIAQPYCTSCLDNQEDDLSSNLQALLCWLPFFNVEQTTVLTTRLVARLENSPPSRDDMNVVADVIHAAISKTAMELPPILDLVPTLLRHSQVSENSKMLSALKSLFEQSLPVQQGPSSRFSITSLSTLTTDTVQRYRQILHWKMPEISLQQIMMTSDDRAMDAFAPLVYRSETVQRDAAHWLKTNASTANMSTAIPVSHHLLEAATLAEKTAQSTQIIAAANSCLKATANKLLTSRNVDDGLVQSCEEVLRNYISLAGVTAVVKRVSECIPSSAPLSFNRSSLRFMGWAVTTYESVFKTCFSAFIDGALRWIVRRFSEDETDSQDLLNNLPHFGELLAHSASLKRSLVEPVLTSVLRSRFTVPEAVDLACTLFSQVELPSDITTRFLQSALQHAQLKNAASVSSPRLRAAVMRLLHTLCSAQPQAAYQPAQMRRIISLYNGSLSGADRIILNLLALFEKQRSSTAIAVLGTSTDDTSSTRPIDLLLSLDATRIFKTCLDFPLWRDYNNDLESNEANDRADLYDPVYLLGLFSAAISQDNLQGHEWLTLGRTDIVSLAICGLASKHAKMRRVAYVLLAATWKAIQETDFFERDQLSYILQLLRNVISSDAEPERLPTYTVLLGAYAVHSLFHPTVLIYPIVSRFLLQRPAIDTTDVPMLYGMLYSSTDEWRKERLWMIRFLANGMKSAADWRAMRRRRAWDLLATLFQSERDDRQLRAAIFDVLGSTSRNQYATHALVLRSGLLGWIGTQLLTPQRGESLAWLRVLENICMIVDAQKVENDTYGSWRVEIVNCVKRVLGCLAPDPVALHALHLGARTMLRLASFEGGPPWNMPYLLDQCVTLLQGIENTLGDTPPARPWVGSQNEKEQYHRSITHPPPELSQEERAMLHAQCVRKLWRVGMALPFPTLEEEAEDPVDADVERERRQWWFELTPRLIVLGEAGGEEASWARREVMRCIVLQSREGESAGKGKGKKA